MLPAEEARRYRLISQLMALPVERLAEVEAVVQNLQQPTPSLVAPIPSQPALSNSPDLAWPHAPLHRLAEHGTYFVTTGTYLKHHHFRGAERLDCLHAALLAEAKKGGWQLEAWAVFSNHYHFVAHAQPGAEPLGRMLKELHRKTAIYVNELDGEQGRQVWHNSWETELTIETSYSARLAYAHNNPVKHRLVPNARLYRWCSAGWFERVATPAQAATIARIKTDRVNVPDEYEPV